MRNKNKKKAMGENSRIAKEVANETGVWYTQNLRNGKYATFYRGHKFYCSKHHFDKVSKRFSNEIREMHKPNWFDKLFLPSQT